jgi:uncharacterized protein (TIGR02099 family)
MNPRLIAVLTSFGRLLLFSSASLVAVTVMLILIGRQTVGQVDGIRAEIETFLVDNTGLQVELGEVKTQWSGLLPVLDIASLLVSDGGRKSSVSLANARAELDLARSLWHLNMVWRELTIDTLTVVITEDEFGSWLPSDQSNIDTGTELDVLLKPFTHSRLINLRKIEIQLRAFSGQIVHLQGGSVKIENDNDFHRGEMSLFLSDNNSPARFVIEGFGDPSDLASFSGLAYLKIDDFDISSSLVDLGQSLVPGVFSNIKEFRAGLNSQLWIDIQPGGSLDFEGSLSVAKLPLDWFADAPAINNVESNIIGWYLADSEWGFRLQDLKAEWSDTVIEPLNILYSQRFDLPWRDYDVSVNYINLSFLSGLIEKANIADDAALNIIDQLDLQGELSALTYGHNKAGYFASANITDVDMAPFKGIPGVKGVDGYVEVSGNQSLVHLADQDGLSLFFPGVYKDYLPINKALGTIYIAADSTNQTTVVRSSLLKTELAAGNANFLFSVALDTSPEKTAPITTLLIGATDIDASYTHQYLPYKLSPPLLKWLQEANLKGNVKQLGLLQRFGPGIEDQRFRTTQLLVDIKDGQLDYHPQWLGLRDISATVLQDDGSTTAHLTSGTIGEVNLSNAKITTDKLPPNHPNHSLLLIDAHAQATVSSALKALSKSPLQERIGVLSDWKYNGNVDAILDLHIPLSSMQTVVDRSLYQVTSTLNDAQISIPNTPYKVTDIYGQLDFSGDKGFTSNTIKGRFWQQPLKATFERSDGLQKIKLTTSVQSSSLNQIVQFPWNDVLSGNISLEGLVVFNPLASAGSGAGAEYIKYESPVTLTLKSQLIANAIKLPLPLGKAVGDPRSLALKVHFDQGFSRLEGTLGDKLVSDLRFYEGRLQRGLVSYDRTLSLPDPDQILVGSHLATTEIESWQPLIKLFQGTSPTEQGGTKTWSPIFDLSFDYLAISGIKVRDIRSKTTIDRDQAKIDFTSDVADGRALVPFNKDAIPRLNLTRLALSNKLWQTSVDRSLIDPRLFTGIDVSVDKLTSGENVLGNFSLSLRPMPQGAILSSVTGNIFGLQFESEEGNDQSQFFWGFNGKQYSSRFKGSVSINDVGEIFTAMNLPPPIDSEFGKVSLDLQWADQPWLYSKENLLGTINMSFNKGRFYNSSGGGGAVLKLVSLFNVANWLRRLKLDFSDVVGGDIEYSSLDGSVYLDNGTAQFLTPLNVQMSFGKMTMAGEFDLIAETADAQLVATLPLTSNLPWMVAFLANAPAAAGVYITSKIVSKQVDRLSSISYRIKGPWDNLDASVDQMFAPQLENGMLAD